MKGPMRRFPLAYIPYLLLAAVVAAGALWRLGDLRAHRGTETVTVAPVSDPRPFRLDAPNGIRRRDTACRGKYMLVFFAQADSRAACPTSLAGMGAALDKMGTQA